MAVEIHKCNCKSEFQDKEYGKDNRVFNTTSKGEVKCTVCNRTIKTEAKRK